MLDLLHTPLVVLHVFVCLMLMLVVLIQPGKSGGLGAALGGAGATQIFGGRGAGNFLTRTTWIAASVFFLTSVTLAYLSTSTGDSLEERAKAAQRIPGRDTGKAVDVTPAEEASAPAGQAPAAPEPAAPAGQAASEPAAPAGQAAPEPAAPAAPAPGGSSPAAPDSPR